MSKPVRVNAPHAQLRFVELDDYIYYMELPVYEDLTPAPLGFEIPIVQAIGLNIGRAGVRCGYRFSAPRRLMRVQPNYLIVAREPGNEWTPLLGLPGLQVYTSANGVALISTRITHFLGALQS